MNKDREASTEASSSHASIGRTSPRGGDAAYTSMREIRLIVLAFLRGRAHNVHKVGICALRMLFLPPVKEDREMAGLLRGWSL